MKCSLSHDSRLEKQHIHEVEMVTMVMVTSPKGLRRHVLSRHENGLNKRKAYFPQGNLKGKLPLFSSSKQTNRHTYEITTLAAHKKRGGVANLTVK